MYDFHYNYFKKRFDVNLLFTDTDSLVYEVRGVDDVYKKFMQITVYLILVIIRDVQGFMMCVIKELLVK